MDTSESVFSWKDGAGRDRKGDPLDLLRRLNCGSPKNNINHLMDAAESPDEAVAVPGAKQLAALVCKVFRLGAPFDEETGAGVLESRWRFTVLHPFLDALEKNAPPAGTLPISQPSSAPTPSDSAPASASVSASTSDVA